MWPFQLEATPVLMALAHVVLGVIVLIAAKLVKDWISPYNVDRELTAKDNPAFGLAVAGYYAATVMIYLGVARTLPLDAGTGAALRALGLDIAWALGGIVALNLSRWLMDRLMVKGAVSSDEIVRNRNVAAGAVEAGVYIASGLVLSGAIREPGGTVWTAVVFYLLSQFVLIGIGRLYQRWAGYDVSSEIRKGNLAAGAAFSLTLVALSLLMLKATSGEFVDWTTNLSFFAFDVAAGFVLLLILRWVTDAALLPNARIAEEIVRDRNINVGLIEGVLAASIAAIVLYLF